MAFFLGTWTLDLDKGWMKWNGKEWMGWEIDADLEHARCRFSSVGQDRSGGFFFIFLPLLLRGVYLIIRSGPIGILYSA